MTATADTWLPTRDAARLAGRSRDWLAKNLVRSRVHGHRVGDRHAGAWWVPAEVARLALCDISEQVRACAHCAGRLPAPPQVAGYARRRLRSP